MHEQEVAGALWAEVESLCRRGAGGSLARELARGLLLLALAPQLEGQAPQRITHLALLDTTPYTDGPERQALRLEQVAQVEQGRLREIMVGSLKPLYLAAQHRGDQRLLGPLLEMAGDLGAEVFRRQSLALRDRPDSTPILTQITCPTLVLCGREDALCPVAYHEAMASAIPNADLQVLSGCGHLSPMERPEAVTAALRELLRRCG